MPKGTILVPHGTTEEVKLIKLLEDIQQRLVDLEKKVEELEND